MSLKIVDSSLCSIKSATTGESGCNQFFFTQHMSLQKLADNEKIRFNKKLVRCSYYNSFTDCNINKIKNIKYICTSECSNSKKDYTIVLHGSNDSTIERSNNIFPIHLDPLKYSDTPRMLLEPWRLYRTITNWFRLM